MSRHPRARALLVAALGLAGAPPGLPAVSSLGAQQPATTPSFASVAGHEFGERITLHPEAMRWLEALAEASPRVVLLDQGESWEGRRLLAAVVTSPANHARLEEIRETARRLGDPRRIDAEEAARLAEGQPVIVWLGGSIHGDELSGSEGLLKLLERLATADDPETLRVLDEAVVLVDPMLNPDGRDRFALLNRQRRALAPQPDPADWNNDFTRWEDVEHRTGHWYFDTNRDWFAHTQRETRARAATIREWRPQVSVDAHEMGRDVEFYFDPAAEPYGPWFPPHARAWFDRFNERYAAAFDSAGFEYMTRERYNYFYPGYTTSWSSYQGSIGMLYEQGTSQGLAVERPDGSVRDLKEALEHHYLAAWTAVRTAAERREELLTDYHASHRGAVAEGGEGARRYLLPPGAGDPGLAAELVDLLRRNGIEVGFLREEATLEGVRDRAGRPVGRRSFPAGTAVVDAAQPRGRLLRALLEPDLPLPPEFLEEARARVDRDANPRFYDITAWSLPLLFDLETWASDDARPLPTGPSSAEPAGVGPGEAVRQPSLPEAPAGYAYLVDGRQAASAAVAWHLADRGHRAGVLLGPTRIGGEDVAGGTVVVKVGANAPEVHDAVRELALRYGVDVRAVDTGLAQPGFPSLGSADVMPVRRASIALLAEGPVHGYSFGWAWYTLAAQHGVPVTVLRAGSVADRPLAGYDVLVVPDLFGADGLAGALGEEGRERLRDWVRDGGTLVTVGEAVEFARSGLGLLDLRSWYEAEAPTPTRADKEAGTGERPTDSNLEAAGASGPGEAEGGAREREEAYRFEVPGAVVAARADTAAWITAGLRSADLPVLVTSDRIFLPSAGPPDAAKRVAVRYAAAGAPLRLSGHLWPESEARLPGGVFLYERRVGDGRVIAFAEEPNFRAFWRGANRLFLNAVLLGPSAP